MKELGEVTKESHDPFKPIADTLFAYLHDVIYNPASASLNIELLPESFHNLGKGLLYFNHITSETRFFAKELAAGNLDCAHPPPDNELASSLKSLHASLKHLTWQTQQVAKGDYNQRVDFMGDFSVAFNNMIEQLEQRRKITLGEKVKLELYVRLILENNPNPILLFDSEGKLAYASNSYFQHCRIFAIDEVLGKQIHDLFAPIVPEQSLNEIKYLYKKANLENHMVEIEQEIDFGRPESNGHYKIQMTPMLNSDGSAAGIILIFINVTESIQARLAAERARELAEQSTRSKSNFLARMSHEIRTPMNAILGMAELALREHVPPAAEEHIRTIRKSGLNLLSIINDILDFSKIETGKLEIVAAEYLFSSIINDAINIIKTKITESRLRFLVNIDCNIPDALFGDAIRMRQILINILDNAVKYTEKGFVSFTASAQSLNDDTVILEIEIKDSGRGIKQEEIGKLFNDFARFNLEDSKEIEGTGLGLSITRGLVSAMDGEITVDSEYGKGSSFKIILPQKIIRNEKIAAVKTPEEKNVLIYERREINSGSIVKTLDNLGVNSKLVSTTSDFFDSLASKEYSFVLLSSFLYDEVSKKGFTFEPDLSIAVIVDFGEVITVRNVSVLSMPLFSIPVANFLNGVSDSSTVSSRIETNVKFIAPEAKVLIVDDIETNLEVAEGLLLPYKMQIALCASGKEAIEKIKSTLYDLVFMDRMMPEMDGVEAVGHIRALSNENSYFQNVPIVALTADAVFGTRELLLEKGFDDFLAKPIDITNLYAILEKWIPKEKQKAPGENLSETTVVDAQDKNNDTAIAIEGLDTEKGIAMAGGKIKRYKKILSLFSKDGLLKINEIKACLEAENTSLYTVYVHALKSATTIIGADVLSEAAKALEAAGKQGDIAFIHANNSAFIADLQTLIRNISVFLSREAEKEQGHVIDKELLKNELSRLKTALVNFDISETNNALDILQGFTQAAGVGDSINFILQSKLTGDFDEAISGIETLLQELNKQ